MDDDRIHACGDQPYMSVIPRTELANPISEGIDTWPVMKILRVMNSEDHRVAPAIARELGPIAQAVSAAVKSLSQGGRLAYFGSGTSGRIAVLDASEIPPTFGVSPDVTPASMAGGKDAFFRAVEGAEDSVQAGQEAVIAQGLGSKDVVLGIASSGSTPYVAGALAEARKRGATTVALVGDPNGKVAEVADIVISPDVGPEIIAGSTRLKNGTAQKMVLNMISTATMICLGRTYSNLMAGTSPANLKLSKRARRILLEATGKAPHEIEDALAISEGHLDVALVSLKAGVSPKEAREALESCGMSIRKAVEFAAGNSGSDPCEGDSVPRDGTYMDDAAPGVNAPRLIFGSPREAGLDEDAVARAFEVVRDAVDQGEGPIPGAVAAIVRNGVLVGPRAFGWAVRQPDRIPCTPETVFDLASLTKVVVTTPLTLLLAQKGLLRLDDAVSIYLPQFAQGGKDSITVRHLMTHTSGLPAHVKFYEMGLTKDQIIQSIFSMEVPKEAIGAQVIYSDLGFMILGKLIEAVTGKPLYEVASSEIFEPLGMKDTLYNPPQSLKHRIAATEYRQDLGKFMWGEVHDENAYSLGGVAGHAGLFSTAQDLARYALMWLGEGSVGNVRILSPMTVREAISQQTSAGERRGLGWIVKSPAFSSGGDFLGPRSFGHTGFTGTSLWCDPDRNLAVILLTNRVHAGRQNNSVIRLRALFANAAAGAVIF